MLVNPQQMNNIAGFKCRPDTVKFEALWRNIFVYTDIFISLREKMHGWR